MFFFVSLLFILCFVILSIRYNWWRKTESLEKARVFMYHSISDHVGREKYNKWRVKPKEFQKQMAWLYNNGWSSYTASELVTLNQIPEKSFVITFDDGFEDNYLNAFPILKKYQFKATIYLVPNKLTNEWEKENTLKLSQLLNVKQIHEMNASGLVEFGAHTLSHVNLEKLSFEEARIEIVNSKREIERLTNTVCNSFAYPYGKFDSEIIKTVESTGYTSATVVKRGMFAKGDDVFTIKRLGILGTESFVDFLLKVFKVRNKL